MKFRSTLLMIFTLFLIAPALAAPKRALEVINEEANKRTRLSDEQTGAFFSDADILNTLTSEPRIEDTSYGIETGVHFSQIPSEILASIASYLVPEEMSKLSKLGWVPNRIVMLAASRLESFKLKKDLPVIEQLKFLLKGSNGNNTRLKKLDTDDVVLTNFDINFITDHFFIIENFRIPHELQVVATLQNFLKSSGGTRKLKNETLKFLDVSQVRLDESCTKWIDKHFPNAPINYINPLKTETELYGTLPEGFVALGPTNIYQIRDPENRVGPFILSHVSNDLDHIDGLSFCADRGGRLPSKEEIEALGRAMIQNGSYNSSLIPDMKVKFFWSSQIQPGDGFHAFYFDGDDGGVKVSVRDGRISVRCVLP